MQRCAQHPSLLAILAVAAAAGCADGVDVKARGADAPGPASSLTGHVVEIADGRFVPQLVAVKAAQPITFVNRDDVPHRIVKVSGPGDDFRSGRLDPGESYRVSLVGRGGWKLRSGKVDFRSAGAGRTIGHIAVYGTIVPRRDDPRRSRPEGEPPARPDQAAQQRARGLAAYVSQCQDFRRCDTPAELVEHLGGGHAVQFVPGSDERAVESAIATHGPEIAVGGGPDETSIQASRSRFEIVARSRTGREFVLEGTGRNPRAWKTRCAPAGQGECGPPGNWR